jgi:broad specificity phosphatase PhoE
MTALRRIVLVRHGDTVGDSRLRLHGSADPALSPEGRAQIRAAGRKLAGEVFEVVAASPLRRSWESAALLAGGANIRLVPEFREIHFGHWEGLTAEEIQAQDPVRYDAWQARAPDFEFPGGERRADFRARALRGLERVSRGGVRNALVVVHRGVIRSIAEHLLGQPLAAPPELGDVISLTRDGERWILGRRSSDPAGFADAAA